MPRIVIQKSKPKHAIYFIQPLMQIVVDFLQYEEAIEIYHLFKCSEPQRPLFKLSGKCITVDGEYMNTRFVYDKTKFASNNIIDWYIPFEKDHVLTTRSIIGFIESSLYERRIHLECGLCGKYAPIEVSNETFFKGYCTDSKLPGMSCICPCVIPFLLHLNRLQFNGITKQIVDAARFDSMLFCHYSIPDSEILKEYFKNNKLKTE